MNDNIDKNEIRRAIDRLQIEHPCNIAYDPTAFVSMEAVNTIKGCVDKIARRMMEDTEINIICEFAKLYLEGVRPMVMPKKEWIPCSERLPDKMQDVLISVRRKTDGDTYEYYIDIGYWNYDRWIYNADGNRTDITAWMELPEPYEGEGDPDA